MYYDVADAFEQSYKDFGLTYRLSEVNYPAVAVANLGQIFEAYISAGRAYEFGASVEAGVQNVLDYSDYIRWKCPDTKFALIGYSQGAMVVKDAAKSFESDELGFLLAIGDPETYLPEGEGWFPRACTSSSVDYSLSRWRYYAPECHTFEGLFGGAKPYEPDKFRNKYALMCNENDFICGSSHNPFRNSGHTAYAGGLVANAVHDLVDAKFRMDWVNLLEGLTERPEIGLSSIDLAESSMRRFDGDKILLTWRAPPDAEFVLISLNGVVLGYVDAGRGEIEIRDVDYRVENKFTLSFLSASGDVVETETYEPPSIILPLDDAQETPVVISDIPPEEPAVGENEFLSEDSPGDEKPSVSDEPEMSLESPADSESEELVDGSNDEIGDDGVQTNDRDERPVNDESPSLDSSQNELRDEEISPIGSTSDKITATASTDARTGFKITIALLGAGAALALFWFSKRH